MVTGKKKRKPLGTGRLIILLLCGIVFVGCAGYLGLYAKRNVSAQHDFKAVAQLEESGLQKVYDENSDTVGWIEVEGTKIDYPVMQTPEKPKYYLYRDFDGESSAVGTPFVDGASHIAVNGTEDEISSTCNWLIHGHNIKAGTMFHTLLNFEEESFWENHRTFRFSVITSVEDGTVTAEDGEYDIFAVCRSRIREKDEEGFRYYRWGGINDEEAFKEYVTGVKSESIYETGITPEYGDQLVTLSTCAYHTENGRFYVVGVKK